MANLCGRDYTSLRTKHRAEHLARDAAAASHASYYAHPALHIHTYLDKSKPAVVTQEGKVVGALNDPAQPLAQSPAPETLGEAPPTGAPTKPGEHVHNIPQVNANTDEARKVGTEGTKEEEGGKEDAGAPSGLDKGALEVGGEAGGTKTSPGPTAEEVASHAHMIGDKANMAALGVPNGRPGMERHWSVSGKMQPHLQLMCGPLLAYYTVKDNVWQGAAMVVSVLPHKFR